MKIIKILAVIAAMAVGSTLSAQNYNFLSASYSNVSMTFSGTSVGIKLNGVSVGVSQARALSGDYPILYEYGINAMAAFGNVNYGEGGITKSTLASLMVPVNLMLDLNLGQIHLLPYCGLNLTGHIIGKGKDIYYDDYDDSREVDTYDWFSNDEDGDGMNRFQLGAQFGAKILYGKYLFGISYNPYLTKLDDESTSLRVLNFSFGLTF